MNSFAIVIAILMLSTSALAGDHRGNKDEVGILTAVLESEVSANRWTSSDLICISVDGKAPNRQFLDELRQHKLNVCSQAEWRRRLACEFAVFLSKPASSDPSGTVRVRFSSVDLRRVNTGEEHFAGDLRHGEYTLRKGDQRWEIIGYNPGP